MYVSALDRPWLETPFLFQGFLIRDQEEIGELQRHCEYVYVDPEESANGVDFKSPADESSNPRARSKSPHFPKSKDDEQRSACTDLREVRRELAKAKDQHDRATVLIHDVMDNLNNGGRLDVHTARKAAEPIVESVMKNPSAMTWLVRMRQTGDYLYRRSVSSAIWATIMARHLGLSREDVEAAGLGAMLLDIGKTRIPKEILMKPGPLTQGEMAHARRHVEFGVELLKSSGNVEPQVRAMLQTHHERHDGSGYPSGLSGQQIPVHGRIAGIVDTYDAMTSDRPYARARSSYDCLRTLNRLAGTVFQAEMVEQFVQSIGFFPPGTLVELNDRSVAVVVAQNRRFGLKPRIMLVMDPDRQLLHEFLTIDLQMPVNSTWTDEPLYIDKGLEPGSCGIDPAEFFLE